MDALALVFLLVAVVLGFACHAESQRADGCQRTADRWREIAEGFARAEHRARQRLETPERINEVLAGRHIVEGK